MYPIPYKYNLSVWFKKFCFGTSYRLQYNQISFSVLSTVGVPNNLREPARTYQEPEDSSQPLDPGLNYLISEDPNLRFLRSAWYK